MTDRNRALDPNETPEDVATLYSWANLHGAKYRDFSASRAQTRDKARQRVQEAIETERRRVHERSEEEKAEEKAAELVRGPEAVREAETGKQNAIAAERLPSEPGQQSAERQLQLGPASMGQPAAIPQQPYAPAASGYPPYQEPALSATPVYGQPEPLPGTHPSWQIPAQSEYPVRPAWLGAERADSAGQWPAHAPEDTLQGSRDRLTSRWFALKGVFQGAQHAQEAVQAAAASPLRAPVLAVFSLAGGVGKTSIVANLGRTLASRGERMLLVETAAFGLLPFYFGACDQRAGVLRTFTAPGTADAPVQMLTLNAESAGPENAAQEMLTGDIARHSQGCNRILVDLATASVATTRRVLRMVPAVLVPVLPDMNSVVSVGAIDTFFRNNSAVAGQPIMPVYVLNQFDPSLPLHLDVREVLREQLGDRLLPFALRRTPAVSEALAEGMTVVDYAPTSTAAEDFGALAAWVKGLSAPGSPNFRGVRWSER